jgi:signal transduction histidine kinase
VAILSEVARREAPPAAAALMAETASLARAMRESLSDIVWAVDPRQDRLSDLVHRMRQVACNALETDGLQVDFRAPADEAIARITLPPDRQRHLLLIFKEAATNVLRHAQASHVRIDLAVIGGAVRLTVCDDGRGFDYARRNGDGQGLRSLERRASELGAHLAIESSAGSGTTIRVTMPLK